MSEEKLNPKDDAAFARAVVDQLDDQVDADIAVRLRAARQEAVYAAEHRTTRPALWLAPAGGVLAAAVVAAVMLREPGIAPLPNLTDSEMAAAADLEFLEALEMMAWIEESESDAG